MNPRIEETIAGTITEQVAFEKGVALLDKEIPDWADKIDLETFNIRKLDRCVLGQLGGYETLQSYLGIKAKDFGFEATLVNQEDATEEAVEREYDNLEMLWENAIRERQDVP